MNHAYIRVVLASNVPNEVQYSLNEFYLKDGAC